MYHDFTLLIQGSLNQTSINKLKLYRERFKHIIISGMLGDDRRLLKGNEQHCDEIILKAKKDDLERKHPLLQLRTIVNGLYEVKTKYVIKIRSDEYYTNFDYMVDHIRSSPYKLTTGDFFFTFDSGGESGQQTSGKFANKYYISDHLFGTRTDLLLNTCLLMEFYMSNFKVNRMKSFNMDLQVPHLEKCSFEPMLACCFMMNQGEMPTMQNSIELMQKYITVVPMERMGQFKVKSGRMEVYFEDIENYRRERKSPFYIDEI